MTWLQSGKYAYTNGAKAISRKTVRGIVKHCAWDGKDYVCHSESEAESVLSLITDPEEITEYIESVRLHEGKDRADALRAECRSMWRERKAA